MCDAGRQHEVSAGVLVFRGDQVLIIKNRIGEWVLPKGRLEPGETPEKAAIREVAEETGIHAQIVGPAGKSEYSYVAEQTGLPVDKVVYWFVGHDAGHVSDCRGAEGSQGGERAGRAGRAEGEEGAESAEGAEWHARPVPQRDEGITAACFVPWQEAAVILKYDGALVASVASRIVRDATA